MSCINKEGNIVMSDALRRAKAETLAALGFPVPLAYYALETKNDNQDAAAEWLITQGIAFTETRPDVDWLGDD